MFIIKILHNEYSEYSFVTDDESFASRYVEKYNRILYSYKEFYSKFEEKGLDDYNIITEEYIEYFDRWENLNSIVSCGYEEVENRNYENKRFSTI